MPSQITSCVCPSGSRPNQPLGGAPDTVPADPSGPWTRRESTSDRPAGPHTPGRLLRSYPPCRNVGRSGMHTSDHFLPARGLRAAVGRADRKSCPDHLNPKDTVYPILAGSFARRPTAFAGLIPLPTRSLRQRFFSGPDFVPVLSGRVGTSTRAASGLSGTNSRCAGSPSLVAPLRGREPRVRASSGPARVGRRARPSGLAPGVRSV